MLVEIGLERRVGGRVVGGLPGKSVLRAQTEHAIEQVADILAEVGVVALEERGVIEVAVLSERDGAKKVVTEHVRAELARDAERIDTVFQRLGEFLTVDREKAMREDLARKLFFFVASREQERGPIHGVEPEDVFAHEMNELGVATHVRAARSA